MFALLSILFACASCNLSVCLLVGCLMSQQHASVSQGRILTFLDFTFSHGYHSKVFTLVNMHDWDTREEGRMKDNTKPHSTEQ